MEFFNLLFVDVWLLVDSALVAELQLNQREQYSLFICYIGFNLEINKYLV